LYIATARDLTKKLEAATGGRLEAINSEGMEVIVTETKSKDFRLRFINLVLLTNWAKRGKIKGGEDEK